MTNWIVFGIVAVTALILAGIAVLHRRGVSFNKLVFGSLLGGIIFGFGLQFLFGQKSAATVGATSWISIVGNGYIALLQMLIIPLITVSLIGAFTRLEVTDKLRKIATSVLTTLLGTTAVAALFGFGAVLLFHLEGAAFVRGLTPDKANLAALTSRQTELSGQTLPQQITGFFPRNIFADLSGSRATSTIAVVIFSLFVGIAYLGLKREAPTMAASFAKAIDVLGALISRIVKMVLQLTPYGIFALMINATATASLSSITSLGAFILAAYVALMAVLLLHTVLLLVNHINPLVYFKKVWPALLLAFTSRSSAGTLPLNIKVQTEALGVDGSIANFAGSFGLTMGQNGCAGVYPAMIATIIAPTVGINVFTLQWLVTLVLIVTISSFGVAGVGGGATFSTLMVLGALNLPITIMGVIVAIDPIVDMGRTAINVNDSMLAGVIAASHTELLDHDALNNDHKVVSADL